jgi:3-isopropylmalate/(R)-2-methylmalate dehydratase small subunit
VSAGVQRSDGSVLPCQPIPVFLMDMVHAGGLMNVLKQRSQGTHHA